ncbi:MAG: IS66 family transposase [Candidatus Riflebacteria bacterium]|nr:IS66 family transposase [Candidatus Riflebacteria bacterium]
MSKKCPNCEKMEKRIAELEAEVAFLNQIVKELLAKMNQNSSNSHLPPSTDLHRKKRKVISTGKRPKGPPKGHPGNSRKFFPPEKVTVFHDLFPQQCNDCGNSLVGGKVTVVENIQQIELPQIEPIIREIHRFTVECPCCRSFNRSPNPFGKSSIGARLGSFIAILRPKFHLSLQHTQDLLVMLLGEDARFSRSTLLAEERRTSIALAQPYQEALTAIQYSPAVWADETGWRENGKKTWLWTATNANATVFRISPSRGKEGFSGILRDYQGLLTSDRWCAYSSIPADKRQLCITSHLERDFVGLIERDLGSKETAQWAREEIVRIRKAWESFRNRTISKEGLKMIVRPIRSRFKRMINQLLKSDDSKAVSLGKSLKKHWKSLWTFVKYPEILELSNNRAERVLRQPVVWRVICQGSKSARGATFAHRAMTMITSLKQKVWNFIQAAKEALAMNLPTPRMFPVPSG